MPYFAIKQCINNLFSLPLIIKELSRGILEQTAEIMETYQITAYDALFAATAKESDSQLISDNSKGHSKITDGTILMLEDYRSKN